MNCLLAAWYGLPFISRNNILLTTVNGTGAVLELCYVIMFLFYIDDKKYWVKIFGLLVLELNFFALVVLVSLLAMHGHARKYFCGFAAAIFSICMYAAPLSIMITVVKTKSVKYMPFFLSLFVFLSGTSWFVFGLLGKDPFVIVANGVGCALGAVQLVLYAIYNDWKKNTETLSPKKNIQTSETSSPKKNSTETPSPNKNIKTSQTSTPKQSVSTSSSPVQKKEKAAADHMDAMETGSYGQTTLEQTNEIRSTKSSAEGTR